MDLFAALLVEALVASEGDDVGKERASVDAAAVVADYDRGMVGLARDGAARAKEVGGEGLLDDFVGGGLEERGVGFVNAALEVAALGFEHDARDAGDGHLPAGEIVNEDLDGCAHARGDVAGDEAGGLFDGGDLRLSERADVELQGLGFYNAGARRGHADFAGGGDGKAALVDPGDFIEAPDVGAAEVVHADHVASERARNGREEVGTIGVDVFGRLAEQGAGGRTGGHGFS